MRTVLAPAGSPDFNARLRQGLGALAADVERCLRGSLTALVLGGGYGRGEGAVVRRDGAERPYNDLDLIVVTRRLGVARAADLAAVGHRHQRGLGVEVDFGRPLTPAAIRRWPHWLMWHDLVHGHVVLRGDGMVLERHAPARVWTSPPAIEATRLLLNRGAGLLWAMRVCDGHGPAPDPDFVRRNYHKCALALGDAALLAHSRYTTLCRGRDERLRQLAADRHAVAELELDAVYAIALRFKLCPDDVPPEPPEAETLRALAALWGRVLLHVEGQRTGRRWSGLAEYARWGAHREVDLNRPRHWPLNLVRNGRLGRWSHRHPREGLYRQLPGLLGPKGPCQPTWPADAARFLRAWRRHN